MIRVRVWNKVMDRDRIRTEIWRIKKEPDMQTAQGRQGRGSIH